MMNEIVLDDDLDIDDGDDDDTSDASYLHSHHHMVVTRAFVAQVRRQLQRDFSRQRLLTVALNVTAHLFRFAVVKSLISFASPISPYVAAALR
jgi:hypothetical protein